jgi:hypothetical protein
MASECQWLRSVNGFGVSMASELMNLQWAVLLGRGVSSRLPIVVGEAMWDLYETHSRVHC